MSTDAPDPSRLSRSIADLEQPVSRTGATDREVEAVCARCGQVRRTKNMERLAQVVARGSRWMKPVYVEAAWPGAPWICSARTSCKVRRRAAARAALLAEQSGGGR